MSLDIKNHSKKSSQAKRLKESGPFLNLLFSIILPVLILNKLSPHFGENGPLIALLVALSFPIALGLYDWIRVKKGNFFSVLGIVSVLLTGGLALLQLEGAWFAVKEASIPLALGLFVLGSLLSKKPVIEFFFFNEQFLQLELIKERLKARRADLEFEKHLRISTLFLAISFFFSAALNYILARDIFTGIDPGLDELARAAILNEQIAQMTWKSYIVIVIPSVFFMAFILWYLFRGIHKLTGLTMEEVVRQP